MSAPRLFLTYTCEYELYTAQGKPHFEFINENPLL